MECFYIFPWVDLNPTVPLRYYRRIILLSQSARGFHCIGYFIIDSFGHVLKQFTVWKWTLVFWGSRHWRLLAPSLLGGLKGGQMGPPGKSQPVHPAAPSRKGNAFKSPDYNPTDSNLSHWCILTRVIIRKKENYL